MTVPFSKEKEVLDQLTQAIELANKLRLGLSKMILEKGVHQKRILSKELQEKCQRIVDQNTDKKTFKCNVCSKEFADGRQLGGHVSRAHYGQKLEKDDSSEIASNRKKQCSKSRSFRKRRPKQKVKQEYNGGDIYMSDEE